MQILFRQLRSYTKFLIFKRLSFEIFAPKGLTRVNRSFHAGDPKPYHENISSGIKGLLEDFEKLYMFLRSLQIFCQLQPKSFSRPFWLPSKSTYDSIWCIQSLWSKNIIPIGCFEFKSDLRFESWVWWNDGVLKILLRVNIVIVFPVCNLKIIYAKSITKFFLLAQETLRLTITFKVSS